MGLHKEEKINTNEYWQCRVCGDKFPIEWKEEHIKFEIKELTEALSYLNEEIKR